MLWSLYWAVPLCSATVWIVMLLAMLLKWIADGSPRYQSMQPGQTIAYISDIGAQDLKPLFIAGSAITVLTFDFVFVAERWLRHRGKLERNTSWTQKVFSLIAIVLAICGGAGLILLSIFDTLRHPTLHNVFLTVFIAGYVLSAVFICLEYWRLEKHFRGRPILRVSFYVKLVFIVVEVAMAVAFGVCQNVSKYNAAAVLEWIIALIYTFYVVSFAIDFLPSARSDSRPIEETQIGMASTGHAPPYANGYANDRADHATPATTASNF